MKNISCICLSACRVVELNPDAKDLFKAVNVENPTSGEFSAHALRVLNGLDMSINLLKDPEALEAALDHLADQHQVRAGVKKAHFKVRTNRTFYYYYLIIHYKARTQ
jgi:Globin